MKLLNLQNVYKNEVKTEVAKMLDDNYRAIELRQNKRFDGMTDDLDAVVDRVYSKLDKVAIACNKSAKRAEESAEKMTSIKEWQDLLQWVSPAAVVLYGIIQLLLRFL